MRFLLPVLLIALLAGCGRPHELEQVKGEFDWRKTRALAHKFAFATEFTVHAVGSTGSNGNFMGVHSFVIAVDSYETITPGKLVVYEYDGQKIIHQVTRGSPDGWQVQGLVKKLPDGALVTRDNYIGTRFGQLDSNGERW